MKSYGITEASKIDDLNELNIESLKLKGYTVIENLLSTSQCDTYAEKLEQVYTIQEEEIGKENLAKIQEENVARMPFAYDHAFIDLFYREDLLDIVGRMLGPNFTLHLQNGIINRPSREHHQASWHRDLPYQDFYISKPLSLNVFYCLTEFNEKNGGTIVLPSSHKIDHFPSNRFVNSNMITVNAKKGSAIIFDSLLYHRAGVNTSESTRYGLNNQYVVPILKQQVDLPRFLGDDFTKDDQLKKLLGYTFNTPESVVDFRTRRLQRVRVQ